MVANEVNVSYQGKIVAVKLYSCQSRRDRWTLLRTHMVVNAVNVSYQGKIVAVKLSKHREVFFFSASMYPIDSSDLIGDDVTMTLHQFLVDCITDDLYISEIDV